jgi:hypothetical protein
MIKSLAKCVLSTAAVTVLAATLFLGVAPAAHAVRPPDNGNLVFCPGTPCGCLTYTPPYNCYWTT